MCSQRMPSPQRRSGPRQCIRSHSAAGTPGDGASSASAPPHATRILRRRIGRRRSRGSRRWAFCRPSRDEAVASRSYTKNFDRTTSGSSSSPRVMTEACVAATPSHRSQRRLMRRPPSPETFQRPPTPARLVSNVFASKPASRAPWPTPVPAGTYPVGYPSTSARLFPRRARSLFAPRPPAVPHWLTVGALQEPRASLRSARDHAESADSFGRLSRFQLPDRVEQCENAVRTRC